MKKTWIYLMLLGMATAMTTSCEKDDTDFSDYDFSNYSLRSEEGDGDDDNDGINIVYINYNNGSVSVTGDTKNYVSSSGADVTVDTGTDTDSLLLVLSGTSADGSLLVYREKKYGIRLNGLTLNNADGPAINNQCKKTLYLEAAAGTTNSLTDGSTYATAPTNSSGEVIDQKGALFSEGQVYFMGSGTLSVTGSCQHAIACDDYVVIGENLSLKVRSATGHGIKVNDGFWMNSGTVDIEVTGNGCKGLTCDSVTVITDGSLTINTTGNCIFDSEEGDYDSAACIKSDAQFQMTGGTLTLTSSGDGGKGINCDNEVVFSGGTLSAITTGSNDEGKPKAVKGDLGIIVSGGSFTAQVSKSWACDNGSESDTPADHLTILGSPTTASIAKKSVIVSYE